MAQGGGGILRMLEQVWHPVCREGELAARSPVAASLLGRDLVVACLPTSGEIVALDDRCLHRSTPLRFGEVVDDGIRCAQHGWVWGSGGGCVHIPGLRTPSLPARARIGSHPVQLAHGLVWICLDERAPFPVPAPPASTDVVWDELTDTAGVAPLRRVEHLLEAVTGAWAGEGAARPPDRVGGELRIEVPGTPIRLAPGSVGPTEVRVVLPGAVTVTQHDADGLARWLWLVVVPVAGDASRLVRRLGGAGVREDDARSVAEALDRRLWLQEATQPAELALDHATEASTKADRVSVAFRGALSELVEVVRQGPGPTSSWASVARRAPG